MRIHDYHPIHRFPLRDIVRRAKAKAEKAKAKIKENTHSHITSRSLDLTTDIIQKYHDTVAHSIDDIDPGDGVIYSYWGLWHEGIVVKKD